ncbi:serine/threonine-protein kinase [Micromonospora vinacea]|uniref:serine/threonine-protein kinase n=1 Tax=Micromonospora vinacea TaxID=709878 RepID=UPI00345522DF
MTRAALRFAGRAALVVASSGRPERRHCLTLKPVLSPLNSRDPREIGGYRLRARLGAGGMGEVYLSFAPGGRPLAIKVIRPEYADDPAFRARFAQEVRAAQEVSGRHTAPLLEAGPDAPVPWLATAYVIGPTLLDAVRAHGPLPLATAQTLIATVASALQNIHSCDVIHRDLSPGNVILAANGPTVIDFGVARATDIARSLMTRTPVGTPGFMAPEVALGQEAVPASDVFALGAIAYFASTGRSAYGDGTLTSQLLRITNGEADLTGCPQELRGLIERCLSVDPTARPTTAEVIAECAGTPRPAEGWLPPALTADIAARTAELARIAAQPAPPAEVQPRRASVRRWLIAAGTTAVVLTAAILVTVKLLADPTDSGRDPGGLAGSSSTPAAQVNSTAAASSPPSPSPSAPASPSATADEVRWTGVIRINGDGIDMDRIPPTVDPTAGVVDLKLGLTDDVESTILGSRGGYETSVANLLAGTQPSPRTCHDQIATAGTTRVVVQKNSIFCFQTEKGLVGYATIKNISGGFTAGDTASATLWATTEFA